MAYLGSDGNLSDVSEEAVERAGRGVRRMLEPGWYRCALVEDEAKPYAWGTGLSLQFQILTGDFENQRVFDFLCVRHAQSETAEQIARAKLKALAIAAGIKNPDDLEDTSVLYNRPIMVEVYREKQKDKTYADEDGCKAKPGQFVSVAKWKLEHDGEPTPGVTRKGWAPAVAPKPAPAKTETTGDEDIPF